MTNDTDWIAEVRRWVQTRSLEHKTPLLPFGARAEAGKYGTTAVKGQARKQTDLPEKTCFKSKRKT